VKRRDFLALSGLTAADLTWAASPLGRVANAAPAPAGILKDIADVPRFSDAEVDFVANNPGLSLFHCHMRLHMDFGFMVMVKYV
jgi:FtsP/CotA-like multicopper oxidase with cupredoxin domain